MTVYVLIEETTSSRTGRVALEVAAVVSDQETARQWVEDEPGRVYREFEVDDYGDLMR